VSESLQRAPIQKCSGSESASQAPQLAGEIPTLRNTGTRPEGMNREAEGVMSTALNLSEQSRVLTGGPMQITEAQLAQVCQAASKYTIARFAPRLTRACNEFGIDTPRRVAAFLAQVAHECGEFRWLREIYGPTPQQKRYEPPSTLAERLGNTEPGDGKRFLGRGLIQLTGRANYRDCSKALFPDDPELLLHRPELLEQPTQACRSAAWFWWSRGLNRYADSNDYTTLTKRINGGTNGLDQRVKYWRRALSAFHVNETVPTGGAGDD